MSAPPLVLHSSRWRVGLQALTPLFLLGFGGAGVGRGSLLLPGILLVLGAAAGLVVLLDLPLRSEFTRSGVTRICALRRTHLAWSEVVAIERLGLQSALRSRRGDDKPVRGGLAARTGPRRLHLLVDRRESHAEFAALRDLLKGRATQLRAKQPPIDAPPAGRGPDALHRRQSD